MYSNTQSQYIILQFICILQSRDDQNDFERRQRQALRAQQVQMQQMNVQQEIVTRNINPFVDLRRRSPSPPSRVQPYTNASMVQLAEKLKNEEQFAMTLPVSNQNLFAYLM